MRAIFILLSRELIFIFIFFLCKYFKFNEKRDFSVYEHVMLDLSVYHIYMLYFLK